MQRHNRSRRRSDDEPDDEPIKVQIPVTVLRLARAARSKQSLDSGSAAL